MRYVIANDELYHHGVLGMKWGVRRYQSYAQKPRKSGKGGKEIGEAKPTHEELIKSRDPHVLYKYKDELSDTELRDRLNRLNMEKSLKTFTKKEKSKARSFVEDLAKDAALVVGLMGSIAAINKKLGPNAKMIYDKLMSNPDRKVKQLRSLLGK